MESVNDCDLKLINIYSTPIWQSEFPNFLEHKKDFLKSIEEYVNENKESNNLSNVNGYQSPPSLHSQEKLKPIFEHISELALRAVEDLDFIESDVFISSSWVNINKEKNAMNSEHIHGDTLSGVLYIKTTPNSGCLCLKNPGINLMWAGCDLANKRNQYTGEVIKVRPVEGNIMIWPSYLPHSVEPNDGNEEDERISISFNIVVLPKNSILKEFITN